VSQSTDKRRCPGSLSSWNNSEEAVSWCKRPAGECPCGGEVLRSCAKPAFSQWMGYRKGEEKSFRQSIPVASSQDEYSAPNFQMD